MPDPSLSSTPISGFFAESLAGFDAVDAPQADVSIERCAEVIRAARGQ